MEIARVRICGQEFEDEVVRRIRGAVAEEPELTRAALSRRVCQWLNWRAANGRLKEMSCRLALRSLEQRDQLVLPPARSRPGQQRGRQAGSREVQHVPIFGGMVPAMPVLIGESESEPNAPATRIGNGS